MLAIIIHPFLGGGCSPGGVSPPSELAATASVFSPRRIVADSLRVCARLEGALSDSAHIGLFTSEEIRRRSSGEITSVDMIDFANRRFMDGGLFCERIFGPTTG